MTIDKIQRLVSALDPSAQGANKTATKQVDKPPVEQNSQAVRLADNFGSQPVKATETDRSAKVAQVKEQVQSGKQPSSDSIARVLLRDLF